MKIRNVFKRQRFLPAALALLLITASGPAYAHGRHHGFQKPQFISTGDYITPTAPAGSTFQQLNPGLTAFPNFTVGQAVSTALSPDGKTLLVLTSGYNLWNDSNGNTAQSSEYVFVFDITGPQPVQEQALQIPNAFDGLAWDPTGTAFYVSGGDDDDVHVFTSNGSTWAETRTISLGHTQTNSLANSVKPEAAGLAVTANGKYLVVANYENDSITLVDLKKAESLGDLDLRPGNGVPGGEFPFWVSIKGNDTAYVSSVRDREIDVIDISTPSAPRVAARIPVKGEPNKMIMNGKQSLLYVALVNSDSVDVINTGSNSVVSSFKTLAPKAWVRNKDDFNGINPNSLALSPGETTLYVTNGGANSLAVIALNNGLPADPNDAVTGLIPTGWYPNSVSVNPATNTIYVVNGKSMTGPVPDACRNTTSTASDAEDGCNAANQYVWQLTKAGFQTIPAPNYAELAELTAQVVRNNHYEALDSGPSPMMAFLHDHIKHIIYIIKENRTYDQILGDLDEGNGDPSLAIFPQAITPNQHELARKFVDLDNFYDSAQTSGDGWNWSTAARTTDPVEKMEPVNYAGRGLSYDFEGTNRNINVGIADLSDRLAANPLTPDDVNILPGTNDVCAPDDSEGDAGSGYLWNAALQAGLSLRNYGFFIDLTRYSLPSAYQQYGIPELTDPYASGTVVAYPTKAALQKVTDPYFRGFDNNFPDFYRVNEWEREFAQYEQNGKMPALELVRVMHDHMGNFATALFGVNTPETQVADNDYAVGRIIEQVANSKLYSNNTLIFVIEDDSQNGPDHVDAHRSIALVAGPYVNQGAVVSTRYTTVNMLRTIGEILGIPPLGINDATAKPMDDVFTTHLRPWKFEATVPGILYTTTLPLPTPSTRHKHFTTIDGIHYPAYSRPLHNAAYWAEKTKGFDFAEADKIDFARFNHILWEGLKGKDVAYPTVRNGRDLSQNRHAFLLKYYAGLQVASSSNPKGAEVN